LLVISSSVSHDLVKSVFKPDITDKQELVVARLSAVGAVVVAGYFGINPPGFVAAVVALAFGLAAASFFPAIILGIFYKKMNKEGAISWYGCRYRIDAYSTCSNSNLEFLMEVKLPLLVYLKIGGLVSLQKASVSSL
jgi:Na+(H+)/acetate symporter ActP